MRCPACQKSGGIETVWSQSAGQRLPRRFTAYNLIRRHRRCKWCQYRFYTIELTEREFMMLLEKAVTRGERKADAV